MVTKKKQECQVSFCFIIIRRILFTFYKSLFLSFIKEIFKLTRGSCILTEKGAPFADMKRVLFPLFLFSLCSLFSFEKKVSAESAIVINADTGAILFQKKAYDPIFPASLTKLITATYVLDKKEVDFFSFSAASKEALAIMSDEQREKDFYAYPPHILEYGGINMGILRGEELPLWALLYGTFISSFNDTSNVLAEVVSGSIPQFMEELNAYAFSLGCKATHLKNPHGLHHPEHVSTVYDLAIIAQAATKNPHVLEMAKMGSFTLPATNRRKAQTFSQTNRLVKPGTKYYYPYAIGLKTGYTSRAQKNLIAAATKKGRTLIAVLVGCPTREIRYEEAIALFETAFSEEKREKKLFSLGSTFTRQIEGASTVLEAFLKEEVKISYYPSEKPNLKIYLSWENLKLPIQQGTKVATLSVEDRGKKLCEEPLFSKKKVGYTFWGYLTHLF